MKLLGSSVFNICLFFSSTGDWSQGLTCDKWGLDHWATAPTLCSNSWRSVELFSKVAALSSILPSSVWEVVQFPPHPINTCYLLFTFECLGWCPDSYFRALPLKQPRSKLSKVNDCAHWCRRHLWVLSKPIPAHPPYHLLKRPRSLLHTDLVMGQDADIWATWPWGSCSRHWVFNFLTSKMGMIWFTQQQTVRTIVATGTYDGNDRCHIPASTSPFIGYSWWPDDW
jgi:hypothetical protein